MLNKTGFQETWLPDSECMELIVQSVSNKMLKAKLCKCDISLSNMSKNALVAMLLERRIRKGLLEYYYLVHYSLYVML